MELKPLFDQSSAALNKLHEGIFLTTKGATKDNTMIISWGAFGELWGRPMVVIMIRDSRCTGENLKSGEEFTLTFAGKDAMAQAWDVAGKESGKDVDKFEALGISRKEARSVDVPIIDTPALQMECKIFYRTTVDPSQMEKAQAEAFYGSEALHTLYFAEILEMYETK